MAAPASASQSAANCPICSAARSSCAAPRGSAARSRFTSPIDMSARRSSAGQPRRSRRCRRSSMVPNRPSLPKCRSRRSLDDRLNIEPGDATLLIVEDDPHYARIIADLAHDKGLKVLVAMRGADALDHRPRVSADGGIARRIPPGHAGLDRAQPAEAGPGDPAHSGAGRHLGRRSSARPRARRLFLCQQAKHDGRSRRCA